MKRKFDAQDRQHVISRVEQHFGKRLSPIGRRPKYLKDEIGNRYWIFGGYGYWHGIPSEMMDSEPREGAYATLVIAIRKKTTIDVYVGSSNVLVLGKNVLPRNNNDDYHFNIKERSGSLFIKEIPTAPLQLIFRDNYAIEQKIKDREEFVRVKQLTRDISRMTEDEKGEFLALLES